MPNWLQQVEKLGAHRDPNRIGFVYPANWVPSLKTNFWSRCERYAFQNRAARQTKTDSARLRLAKTTTPDGGFSVRGSAPFSGSMVVRLASQRFGGSAAQRLSGWQRRWRRLRRRLRRFVGGKPNLKKKSSQIEWRSLDWRLKCTHVHSRTNLPHLSIAFGHCQCYDPILWSLVKPKHLRYICSICTSDFT